ncbi:MAG TPA: glycosyltransferase family 4 protein [Candidatus Binatia bacterium]|jgi:glycosyltransferase involved in cell wall biosynthesis|nr:glycosyltransferase family 4 protein [Candidatus Binatia bacterium]
MRVTHVITRLIVGGAQENTAASVLGLAQKPGLEVDLLAGPSDGPEGSLKPLFATHPDRLNLLPELVRPVRPWKDWVALRRLTARFRASPPDIVHTHSGKAGVLGRLAAARAGVPIIIHTVHGPSFGAFQGALANLVFRAAERHAGKVTTHFVVVADAMREQYLEAGIGRPDQYTKILSGFRLEPFLSAKNDPAFRARLGVGPEDIVVGKIARLTRLKGHDDLFGLAPGLVRNCPQIKFLLIGDGEWRSRFEAQALRLGLGNHFIFAGLVAPDAVAQWVGIMDVVAHLSLREGLARALPQALAAGRPVVAYDCDGAREVCRDDETGFLVPPGDLAGLSRRLLQLAKDEPLRHRLGARGREFVRGRFSVEQMVEELYALYLRLAHQNERRDTMLMRDA